MTRQSIQEYVKAIREWYQKGSKDEKGKILDEFNQRVVEKIVKIHSKLFRNYEKTIIVVNGM